MIIDLAYTGCMVTMQDPEARIYILVMYSYYVRPLICEVRICSDGQHDHSLQ